MAAAFLIFRPVMGFTMKFLWDQSVFVRPQWMEYFCAPSIQCAKDMSTAFASLIVGCHAGNHRNISWITIIIKKYHPSHRHSTKVNLTGITLVDWVPVTFCSFANCASIQMNVCVLALVHVTSYVRSFVQSLLPVNLVSAADWTVS